MSEYIETTLRRSEEEETNLVLIAMTRETLFEDSRIDVTIEENLLPDSDRGAWLTVRTIYGWTEEEVSTIRKALDKAQAQLLRLNPTIGKESLLRDAQKVVTIKNLWGQLFTYIPFLGTVRSLDSLGERDDDSIL